MAFLSYIWLIIVHFPLISHQNHDVHAHHEAPHVATSMSHSDFEIFLCVFFAVSICVCGFCYAVEILRPPKGPEPWRRHLFWIPGAVWMMCGILAMTDLFVQPTDRPAPDAYDCKNLLAVNSDIGGIGVGVGLAIPMALTLVSLFLGRRCGREIGTKEIGSAHLISESPP